jgi:hypothetical protein
MSEVQRQATILYQNPSNIRHDVRVPKGPWVAVCLVVVSALFVWAAISDGSGLDWFVAGMSVAFTAFWVWLTIDTRRQDRR